MQPSLVRHYNHVYKANNVLDSIQARYKTMGPFPYIFKSVKLMKISHTGKRLTQ